MAENSVRLLGRYALHGEIAVGGMATVHFGRLHGAVGFSRTVAIKRLHKQFARDPDFVSMFLDEARLAARIRHPNVVPTLDVVATEGELFVVMEYVHGEALARLIREEARRGRTIPLEIAAAILSGTLQGLHAAHEARDERGQPLDIVHRDVSPQNILVGSDGVARVLDFGVAKAAGRIHTTRQGQIKGKLPYMAPEQLSSDARVTRLVDVYAASVCLWEALTGHRLFAGENEAIVLGKVLTYVVEPPSHYAPGIPPEVDAVVMRGLSRQTEERFATAREMAIALERAAGRIASSAEIADWMERVAGTALTDRLRKVEAIELQSSPSSEQVLSEISSMRKAVLPAAGAAPSEAPSSPAAIGTSPSQVSQLSMSNLGLPRRSPVKIALLALAGAIVLALVLVALAAFEGARRRSARVVPPPVSSASIEPRADEPIPPPPSEPPPSESAPAVSAQSVPEKRPPKTSGSSGSAQGSGSKKNCDPPYSIDSNGRKRFKPECF